jgi:hypothetical protein
MTAIADPWSQLALAVAAPICDLTCCAIVRKSRRASRARSIASLTISFGLVAIPVKLYSATVASERISFKFLRQKNGTRIKQQYVAVDAPNWWIDPKWSRDAKLPAILTIVDIGWRERRSILAEMPSPISGGVEPTASD